MRLIAREAGMSSKRIAWSCAVMALVVAAGSWYAVGAFPLTEPAQDVQNESGPLEKQAKPITPENPIPRRTYSVDPVYPAEAAAVDANAMITLMITLDKSGRVAEVRRLGVAPIGSARADPTPPDPQTLTSAYDALVRSAADAVRQWTYDPPAEAPVSIRVTFAFPSSATPRLVAHDGWSLARPGQFIGFGATGGRGGATQFAAPPPPPPPPPPADAAAAPWATGAVRVGGAILPPTKTKHVSPDYPALAQSAKIQGVVIIEALIGANGKVTNARLLRSIPLLDQAALDAVMQWEFTPTRLNGEPVPVLMTMTVQFTLT
jgi:periplasmic protein TonB